MLQKYTDKTAEAFAYLFEGYKKRYIQVRQSLGPHIKGAKAKAQYLTTKHPLTLEAYQAHLDGQVGLSVIPLMDDNQSVAFGCIDVDDYTLNHLELAEKIALKGLPLLLTKSKSGGGHVWLFLKEPLPAADVQKYLKHVVLSLNINKAELFPKQIKRVGETVGNGVTLPFFNKTQRTGVFLQEDRNKNLQQTKGDIEEFVTLASAAKKHNTPSVFKSLYAAVNPVNITKTLPKEWRSAPPCIQRIIANKEVKQGNRNNFMFNCGVFLAKKHPDEKTIFSNLVALGVQLDLGMDPKELESIAKQTVKKEFNYKCREHPLTAFCDKEKCVKSSYGLYHATGQVLLTNFTKVLSEPPVFFCVVSYDKKGKQFSKKVSLTASQLYNQTKLAEQLLQEASVVWPPQTRNMYLSLLKDWTDDIKEVSPLPGMSLQEEVYTTLKEYIEIKNMGEEENRLETYLEGGVVLVQDTYYFNGKDFRTYFSRASPRNPTVTELNNALQSCGVYSKATSLEGRSIRPWCFDVKKEEK